MKAELLAEVLFYAAKAKTDEERAKVAWRACDYMWRAAPKYPIGFCREFKDWCQDPSSAYASMQRENTIGRRPPHKG